MGTDDRLVLEYPRVWQFTVIGSDRRAVWAAIAEAFAGLAHEVADAHSSRTGRYCSVRVETTVRDQAHRDALFAALAGNADVRVVL